MAGIFSVRKMWKQDMGRATKWCNKRHYPLTSQGCPLCVTVHFLNIYFCQQSLFQLEDLPPHIFPSITPHWPNIYSTHTSATYPSRRKRSGQKTKNICYVPPLQNDAIQRRLCASFEYCMKGMSFEAVPQKNFLTSLSSRFFVCSQSLGDNIFFCDSCLEQFTVSFGCFL